MDTSSPSHRLFAAILLGGLLYVVGQYVASQPLRVQQEAAANREITVQGTGEVTVRPDIARLNFGVVTSLQPTAEAANAALTEKFNAVVAAVRAAGVKEEDIKTTNLSLNPIYDFIEGRRIQRGFEAQESVEIKVRDLNSIGTVLARATIEGVNNVGGVQFDIDDPAQLQVQAQEAAINDAKDNAEQLADALDVNLGRVKSFNASVNTPPGPPIFAKAELDTAQGGDLEVPSGTQDVTATVSITYELK